MNVKQTIPWTTQEILDATGGDLLCGDPGHSFAGVSIDSRNISPGDFFFAIIGESHDGHGFASAAVDQGAKGLVINRQMAEKLTVAAWGAKDVVCISVADTTRALGALAAFNRRRAPVSVVAITGSSGKTTTRQLTAGVVSRQFNMLATAGNFNNEIGLPLTLLKLSPDHQWAIVELGTNNPGEIARLTAICSPDIGVLTNIGPVHLEGLGSLEGVMREKGDLIKGLGRNGKAVLNADDPRVLQLARESQQEVLLYGRSPDAAIRAEDVKEDGQTSSFQLISGRESIAVQLNSPGQHMISNALAAAAVGYLLGIPAATVKAGLEGFEPVAGRMNLRQLPNGIQIIDDTYNANPDSMKAALTTFKKMRAGSRKIFVAGDMLELGAQAPELHRQVGALAARAEVDRLYACGENAAALAAGARKEGMQPAETITGSREEILEDLKGWLQPGDWVLVKGSRGMAMEKVVQGLQKWAEEK
ncbi:MAG: UDP-N-acetylmuramoyl-tripeptide--D-alanyl-D-alanine ligase [Desulfobacteraceae bacterium]|nr:UDP-N-acetylmuramoyl-tripeptide--D-alanyl-D-alanine ligase [Desulfobacteraceae bacterium]